MCNLCHPTSNKKLLDERHTRIVFANANTIVVSSVHLSNISILRG